MNLGSSLGRRGDIGVELGGWNDWAAIWEAFGRSYPLYAECNAAGLTDYVRRLQID